MFSGVRRLGGDAHLSGSTQSAVLVPGMDLRPNRHGNMCCIERSGWPGRTRPQAKMEGGLGSRTSKRQTGNLKRGSVAKLLESITRRASLQVATQFFFLCLIQTCNKSTSISRGYRVREYKEYTCRESACYVACDAISCRDHGLHTRDC